MGQTAFKEEVFTKRVRAGKRTYFFDVKPTRSEKDFYITITESKRLNDEERVTFIFSTHNELVERYAKRVLTIKDGLITGERRPNAGDGGAP